MTLVIGTNDGVWRADEAALADAQRELAVGVGPLVTLRVLEFDGRVYAATGTGLFRSADGGRTWTDLEVPHDEVYAVTESPAGDRLYAGTHPAAVFVSTDDGDSWRELDGFQDLPSREEWHAPRHSGARVRDLRVHPDAPDRVVAGVEAGGVHVSDDRGETWTERSEGVYDDIHHLRVADAEEFVAATGRGLHRTTDGGRTWTRLDDRDERRYYFRESVAFDGTLYTGSTPYPSSRWSGDAGADAVLLESDDGGATFEAVDFPGGPTDAVLAYATDGDTLYAGTDRGRILVRDPDGWRQTAWIPAGVRSLAVV